MKSKKYTFMNGQGFNPFHIQLSLMVLKSSVGAKRVKRVTVQQRLSAVYLWEYSM